MCFKLYEILPLSKSAMAQHGNTIRYQELCTKKTGTRYPLDLNAAPVNTAGVPSQGRPAKKTQLFSLPNLIRATLKHGMPFSTVYLATVVTV